ncbi:Kinesin-related protein 4, partial [Pseudolycoriella hygida]
MSTSNNIKVAIKVRPLISRERKAHVAEQWTVEGNSIVCLNPLPTTTTTTYYFDHVFGKESRNRDVFDKIAHPVIRQSLEGFNGTIFAYGQTSS